MYHCFCETSVITLTLRTAEPVERPVDRRGQREIHDPEEQPEERRGQNHHDRRRVHFLLRRPGDPFELVADFDQKRAAAIPPAGDVLPRFPDVVGHHVGCHLLVAGAPRPTPRRSLAEPLYPAPLTALLFCTALC